MAEDIIEGINKIKTTSSSCDSRRCKALSDHLITFEGPLKQIATDRNSFQRLSSDLDSLRECVNQSNALVDQFLDTNVVARKILTMKFNRRFREMNTQLDELYSKVNEGVCDDHGKSVQCYRSVPADDPGKSPEAKNNDQKAQEHKGEGKKNESHNQTENQRGSKNNSFPNLGPNKMIPQEEIFEFELIAKGSNSQVFRGRWRETNVVIKKTSPQDLEEKKRATKVFSHLDHENILTIYGMCEVNTELWIILELAPLGDLDEVLHKMLDIEIPANVKIHMLLDAARGIEHLHAQINPEILHRDLRSRNLLIFSKCKIKVSDSACARELAAVVTHSNSKHGKEIWLPPEILLAHANDSDDEDQPESKDEKKFPYSKQSDVWSFSMLIYEFTHRKYPFLGDVAEAVTKLRNNRRPKVDRNIRSDRNYSGLTELMERCWAGNFDERPLFPSICVSLNDLLQKYNPDETDRALIDLEKSIEDHRATATDPSTSK